MVGSRSLYVVDAAYGAQASNKVLVLLGLGPYLLRPLYLVFVDVFSKPPKWPRAFSRSFNRLVFAKSLKYSVMNQDSYVRSVAAAWDVVLPLHIGLPREEGRHGR